MGRDAMSRGNFRKGQPPVDWSTTPMIFVVVPTCPVCGSPSYAGSKTQSHGDGSSTRKVHCRDCGQPYRITKELPESGNDDSEFC